MTPDDVEDYLRLTFVGFSERLNNMHVPLRMNSDDFDMPSLSMLVKISIYQMLLC